MTRRRPRELTGIGNLVAVVTDGSAVLGLGDIGPQASLPVMEGKCVALSRVRRGRRDPECALGARS